MNEDPISFLDCVSVCAQNAEFVDHFHRLTQTPRPADSPLGKMIDDAAGLADEISIRFLNFVHEVVWIRLDPALRA